MKNIFTFCALLLFSTSVFSQEVIATAGETFENDEISISWTLGETIIETFEEGDIILTQGFHQDTYEITAIPEMQDQSVNISLFPNPANEEFFIKYEGETFDSYEIGIFDLNGRLLNKKMIHEELTGVDISNLKSSEYIISVFDKNKTYRSYKLIKY
jgi:Secretion system C-terminal sorting domain